MSGELNPLKRTNSTERRRYAKILKDHLSIHPHDLSFSLLGDKFKVSVQTQNIFY